MSLPVVFSLSGTSISEDEYLFFNRNTPYGFILFKRNIDNPQQLKDLVSHLKEVAGKNVNILIDQEGGRVQRMTQPHWSKYPCMRDCTDTERLQSTMYSLATDLTEAGINMNCAPVLDVLQPDTDQSIGDRAFSDDPEIVGKLGTIACQSFLKAKITPIIKHLPGHGRAIVDSHAEIPYVTANLNVLRTSDFLPFQYVLKQPGLQNTAGMVGHCLYTDIDPLKPASLSEKVIQNIIREEIGLSGTLFSDDLSMGALSKYGDIALRAKLCLQAGCDIALYCHGDLDEMTAIAQALN